MEKIFTKMALCIINTCNQNCSYCFEGEWKKELRQIMSLETVKKLVQFKKWEEDKIPMLTLLGGEPTLHPQLIDIIDFVQQYNQRIKISLLTNLTCNTELLQEIVQRNLVFFINVDQFNDNNSYKNLDLLQKNLNYFNKKTSRNFFYNISATLTHPDKDFDFLYEILKRGQNKIFNLRLAVPCIGFGFSNEFQKDHSDNYYSAVYKTLLKCREINPNIHFSSECAVNGCMISDKLYDKLHKVGYNLRFECGEPDPNADILPDLSAHWCFALHGIKEMTINNVFDFSDYDTMISQLKKQYRQAEKIYRKDCNYKNCTHKACHGKCLALNYYAQVIENKSFYER